MELTRKQEEGLKIAVERYKHGEPYTVISGYAGTGKAQPVSTIIPTPNGNKKLGDIKPGDYVFDAKGNPTEVLGVYPQGKLPVYTLKLKDNRETKCGLDHIWTIIDKKNHRRDMTTGELLKAGLTNSAGFKYALPNNGAVSYSEQEYNIDPYVIGAFLGDGCCLQRQLTISSDTDEIPNIIASLIGSDIPDKGSEKNYSWTFPIKKENIEDIGRYTKLKIQTKDFFETYQQELCCDSYEKRIPEIYKYGSVEQRLNLLQGLMDTDGSISPSEGRYNIRYTSVNYKLIQDIQEVLNSLGYHSTIGQDKRSDKYKQEVCYFLNINIANEEKYKLFRLKRKKDLAIQAQGRTKNKNYDKVSIIDIVDEGYEEDMVCIYVDNADHLYLTNDFIVTHNTTLVSFIISALRVDPKNVVFASYTGKAAEVLREKGNENAKTLHKLLYSSKQKKDGTFAFYPRKELEGPPALICIDEISMVPKKMWDLLLSHKVHVLALGDPFQLPPISKDDDNHVLDNPHIFLDEVMRQAKESDIIVTSMDIREGRPIRPFSGNDTQIVSPWDLVDGMYTWADEILTATNKTRMDINTFVRAQKGITSSKPVIGDRVICLRNCWDMATEEHGDPLVNGSICMIEDMHLETWNYRNRFQRFSAQVLVSDLRTSSGDLMLNVPIDYQALCDGKKAFTPKEEYAINYTGKGYENPPTPVEFNYGYSITCHRAQGSQWNKVLVMEEGFPFDKIEHRRWLYTACTRAAEKLTLVLK